MRYAMREVGLLIFELWLGHVYLTGLEVLVSARYLVGQRRTTRWVTWWTELVGQWMSA
jgi:hypothetical protein